MGRWARGKGPGKGAQVDGPRQLAEMVSLHSSTPSPYFQTTQWSKVKVGERGSGEMGQGERAREGGPG